MWLKHINVYDFKPSEIYTLPQLQAVRIQTLFYNMNSPDYYSLYPPVLQLVYYIAAWFDHQYECGLIVLRVINIAVEGVSFYFILKILKMLNKTPTWLALYALNPLVIVELSGNLHGEAIVVCFLSAALYCLLSNKQVAIIALFYSMAVLSKLTPLILFPLFIIRLGWKRGSLFSLYVIVMSGIILLSLFNESRALHFIESFRLYQGVFEFNAGIYYLLRNLLWHFWGYNPIQVLAPLLSGISLFIILTLVIKNDVMNNAKLLRCAMYCYLIYLLLSTTIHPWYLVLPLFFAPFVANITPLVWSFLAILSYSAYISKPYNEQTHFLIFEYVVVFFTFIASETKVVKFFNPSTSAPNE